MDPAASVNYTCYTNHVIVYTHFRIGRIISAVTKQREILFPIEHRLRKVSDHLRRIPIRLTRYISVLQPLGTHPAMR